MSRPVIVYIVMLVTLVVGLWAVLAMGRHIHTPEDLAGKWQLASIAGSSGQSTPGELTIEQSGRFFQIAFDHGPQLDLQFKTASPIVLANKDWQLTLTGPADGDDKTIQLTGPQPMQIWTAHRTIRAFPSDVDAKPAGAK